MLLSIVIVVLAIHFYILIKTAIEVTNENNHD